MAKLSVLLPCLVLFAVLVVCKSSDCPTACGQVDVPYPFGIGSVCAMGSEFRLDCVNTSGRMMLYAGAYEVTHISLSLSKVWLSMPISYLCIDTATGIRTYQHAANLSGTPFSFSDDDNKFFVIGCNTVAYVIQDDSVSYLSSPSSFSSFSLLLHPLLVMLLVRWINVQQKQLII
jgi:hypothetical protein